MKPPATLAELRIWLVSGERLGTALPRVCMAERLRPTGWQEQLRAGDHPDFLLVEGSTPVDHDWGARLDELIERCAERSIPRLLWISEARLEPVWQRRLSGMNRVFTMDSDLLPALRDTDVLLPSLLWPAALPGGDVAGIGPQNRDLPVLWLGGWQPDWPPPWRERLASALRGLSAHGLRIHPAGDLADLPAELRPYVSELEATTDTLLRHAKVVLAADPAVGSLSFAPPVAFDAGACGAVPIAVHAFASTHDFGIGAFRGAGREDLVPTVHDADSAADAVRRLLGDETLRGEMAAQLSRVIANNHTHGHRVATLASTVGYRLAPDAHDSAPA